MSEEPQVIRAINWREVFPFTNIFRSFRVAIHPSKLILAVAALLSLYVAGRVLDGVWTPRHRGLEGEIQAYEKTLGASAITGNPREAAQREEKSKLVDFGKVRAGERTAMEAKYASVLEHYEIGTSGKPFTPDERKAAAENGKYLDLVKAKILANRETALTKHEDQHNKQLDNMKKAEADKKTVTEADKQEVESHYLEGRREIYAQAESEWRDAKTIEGVGLWTLFMDYEITQVNGVVSGVTANNWFGGLTNTEAAPGVFAAVYNFFAVAPRWAFGQHFFYFLLLGIVFLIVWALFGGAIARIAAVHVAREEKISLKAALAFSTSKFLSFVFAPVIPLAIIVVVGLLVAVGGLLLYIPYIGEILVGIFFFLALAAGFVMTLVALGTFGGMNLMYPTIAVEGSDSFDAISRSFSYVYARPWRMLWYTVVAITYGALTFLFVRLFIFLTLKFTQAFVGLWVARHAPDGQYVWAAIYPGSGYWHLPYEMNTLSMTAGQSIAAFFVSLWVYLVITLLGAFVVSFYFSSSTVIYYLMRREVDATELDDVYVEQQDDEFAEPLAGVPATAAATSAPASVTPNVSLPVAPAATITPPVTPPPPTDTPPAT